MPEEGSRRDGSMCVGSVAGGGVDGDDGKPVEFVHCEGWSLLWRVEEEEDVKGGGGGVLITLQQEMAEWALGIEEPQEIARLRLRAMSVTGVCCARVRCAGDAEGVLVVPPVRRRLLSGSCASR